MRIGGTWTPALLFMRSFRGMLNAIGRVLSHLNQALHFHFPGAVVGMRICCCSSADAVTRTRSTLVLSALESSEGEGGDDGDGDSLTVEFPCSCATGDTLFFCSKCCFVRMMYSRRRR